MIKLGANVAFFIPLFATLIATQTVQASSMTSLAWLPLLSANVKKLQPDKHCPQNYINGLQVNKTPTLIRSQVQLLNWDLSCPDKQSPVVPTEKQDKQQLIDLVVKQVSTLPDFEMRFNRINLAAKFINKPFSASLSIQKTADNLNATLTSNLLDLQFNLHLPSQQLSIDGVGYLDKVPHYIDVAEAQIDNLNNELVVHYQSNLKQWHQGDFNANWQGTLPELSNDVGLSITGKVDLLKEQISLSRFQVDAKQIDLAITQDTSWKTSSITLSNSQPTDLNYGSLTLENLPLKLSISSSQLLTRVERGESKRIRIDQQKLPPLLMQFSLLGKKSELLVDWNMQLLMQTFSGKLLLKEHISTLHIINNSIDIKSLTVALRSYVDGLDLVEIETGEAEFGVFAEFNHSDKTLSFDSTVFSNEISGKKDDLLFDGVSVNSRLHYAIDAQQNMTIYKDKQQLKIENVFVGIPIQALQIDARIAAFNPVIDHFKARLLGGRIDFDNYRLSAPSKTLVHLSGISLAEIIKYSVYPEIQVQGLIDGRLPLTVTVDGPEIVDGVVSSRSPGGYIRVPENTVIKAMGRANPAFSLTMQLLSNFQFDTMQGKVAYTNDGESDLAIQIKGKSPTVSATQPINFNYSHNENILKLLQSLRFNEELERHIKERY